MSMKKNSQVLTAFNTRCGQFKYTIMPFGLKNAPSIFQRMMNLVLGDLVDKIYVVYLCNLSIQYNLSLF